METAKTKNIHMSSLQFLKSTVIRRINLQLKEEEEGLNVSERL